MSRPVCSQEGCEAKAHSDIGQHGDDAAMCHCCIAEAMRDV